MCGQILWHRGERSISSPLRQPGPSAGHPSLGLWVDLVARVAIQLPRRLPLSERKATNEARRLRKLRLLARGPGWRCGLDRGDRRARGLAGKVDSASGVDPGAIESGRTPHATIVKPRFRVRNGPVVRRKLASGLNCPVTHRNTISQPAATTPTAFTGRRRSRWLYALLLLVVGIGSVVWWRVTRLNNLEQQFVGHWTTSETFDDGSTCTRTWRVRSDRSLHFRNEYHWVPSTRKPARAEKSQGAMSWSIRDGRLLVNPNHSASKRIKVLWILTRWRVRNAMQGVSGIVMDHEGSNGRLSAVGPNTFTVNWWNPDQKRESTEVVYTRVVTGQQPSAAE